jgi:hypothetical protein
LARFLDTSTTSPQGFADSFLRLFFGCCWFDVAEGSIRSNFPLLTKNPSCLIGELSTSKYSSYNGKKERKKEGCLSYQDTL